MLVLILFTLISSDASYFEPYPAYQCSGQIELPYSDIIEPFSIKYDSTTESSIITYYNTSHYLSSKALGSTVIFPSSYNGHQNNTCLNGTDPQSVFPNLMHFTKLPETFQCRSKDGQLKSNGPCLVWKRVEKIFERKNTYLFFSDLHLNPIRYEMLGYDSLFGSHYDKYAVDYHQYSEYPKNRIDKEIQNLIGHYCYSHDSLKDYHIDLISEFFDRERGDKVHKFHFEATVHSLGLQSMSDLRTAEINHKHSLRFVMSHNRKYSSFKLELNFKSIEPWDSKPGYSCRLKTGPNTASELLFHGYTDLHETEGFNLPDSWDWRAYGAVSPVKDQAICGSCWSFATTGVIESRFFLKTNNSVIFSEQHLVDCSWAQENYGCFGGMDTNAYNYIKSYGLASTDEYGPYKGMDMACRLGPFKQHFKLKGFKRVPNDVKAIMAALYKEGPLSISIDASLKSFSFYKSGVYNDAKCSSTKLDHAVLLVGYKLTGEGKGYWIVKNSWSTNWGNQGYIMISMENNICGVGTEVTFPIFE